MGVNLAFNHIGWAVKSIEKAAEQLELIGFKPIETTWGGGQSMCLDAARKVELALVADSLGNTIELVSPAADDSPVSSLLKKGGASPYHICLAARVEGGFEECRAYFEEAGFTVLHEPEAAPLFGGKDVVFLYSRHIGLIELLIEPADNAVRIQ